MRRVLVLGGTGWLGGEVARAAVADGAEVVCLARGRSGPVPDGTRLVAADRRLTGAYDRLEGDWDDVVELSSDPEQVDAAVTALADRARHWTFVSSVSVYRDHETAGADESADVVEPQDLTDYAHAKVAAERATTARVADRLMTARPGLLAGPGDGSDRFGYWPARLARGGRVLVPVTGGQYVQVIDVADLAAWIVWTGRRRLTGTVDAVGRSHTFDELLTETSHVTGFQGELVPADDAWLLDNDVAYWAGPRSLPLWLPASHAGMSRRDNAAYLAAGGEVRPLRETVERVLADELARGVERERRSGLTADEEADLLARLP